MNGLYPEDVREPKTCVKRRRDVVRIIRKVSGSQEKCELERTQEEAVPTEKRQKERMNFKVAILSEVRKIQILDSRQLWLLFLSLLILSNLDQTTGK